MTDIWLAVVESPGSITYTIEPGAVWFETQAQAQANCDLLNVWVRERYQVYVALVAKANRDNRRDYRRELRDYEVLKAAGRRARRPVESKPAEPYPFDYWTREHGHRVFTPVNISKAKGPQA